MNKKTIITALLVLVAMTGLAQTKTATVTVYSPVLKDGTLVLAGTGTIGNVVDTVKLLGVIFLGILAITAVS